MKKLYQLKNTDARHSVDLRDYESTIMDAYDFHCSDAKVQVFEHHYIVEGDITSAQARIIGEDIAKCPLGQYSVHYDYATGTSTQLFFSKKIKQ